MGKFPECFSLLGKKEGLEKVTAMAKGYKTGGTLKSRI
jgi:hypothetical protein